TTSPDPEPEVPLPSSGNAPYHVIPLRPSRFDLVKGSCGTAGAPARPDFWSAGVDSPAEPWGGAVDHVLMSAMTAISWGTPTPSTPNLKDLRAVTPGLTPPAPQKTGNASTPHSGPGGISNMKLSKNVQDASRRSSYSQIIAESSAKIQR